MSDRSFVDTNVLVYAVDRADPGKRRRALDILRTTANLAISAQILNEFYVVVTRKLEKPLAPTDAAAMVSRLSLLSCVPIDARLVQKAIDAGRRWQLSHRDALVVEAARQAGCLRILTEDLATGANYGGVSVENPFVAA
jgi:predicted nucleic acid-binding protein